MEAAFWSSVRGKVKHPRYSKKFKVGDVVQVVSGPNEEAIGAIAIVVPGYEPEDKNDINPSMNWIVPPRGTQSWGYGNGRTYHIALIDDYRLKVIAHADD